MVCEPLCDVEGVALALAVPLIVTEDVCDWDGVDEVLTVCVWLELCVCERLSVCVWDAVPVALELWL